MSRFAIVSEAAWSAAGHDLDPASPEVHAFEDPVSFIRALEGAAQHRATVALVEIEPVEPDGFHPVHDAESIARLARQGWRAVRRIGTLASTANWRDFQAALRERLEWPYMRGECWHLAIALHDFTGLEIKGIQVRTPEGEDEVHHPFVALPDGRCVDIRGILENEDAMLDAFKGHDERRTEIDPYYGPGEWEVVALDPESIATDLDLPLAGTEPTRWACPVTQAFQERTEAAARLLFGEIIEDGPATSLRLAA
jgi:hypothetical protein